MASDGLILGAVGGDVGGTDSGTTYLLVSGNTCDTIDCDAATTYCGDVAWPDDAALCSFGEATIVDGDFTIDSTTTSVSSADCLCEITGGLEVEGTTGLTDLSGLENLSAVGGLLTFMRLLSRLRIFAKMQFSECSHVTSVPTLHCCHSASMPWMERDQPGGTHLRHRRYEHPGSGEHPPGAPR